MKLFRPTSYANVASTAALVLALGGTSYAAVAITGADIKNGTVTTQDLKNDNVGSVDIRNGTLTLSDISATATAALQGATGPAGPAGPAGPTGATGPQGPIGPSNAYSVYNDNPTVMGVSKMVLALNVPAGAYVVNSKAYAVRTTTTGTSYARCVLAGGGSEDQVGQDMPEISFAYGSLANQMVFESASPATVTLTCNGTQANLSWKKITAIKVGTLSNVAGANVAKVPASIKR